MASNPERRHFIMLTVTGMIFIAVGALLIVVDGELMAYGVTGFGLACAIVGFVKTPPRAGRAPRFSERGVTTVFFCVLLLLCAISVILVVYGLSSDYDFHAYVPGIGLASPTKVVFWGAVGAVLSAAAATLLLVRGIRSRRRRSGSRDESWPGST